MSEPGYTFGLRTSSGGQALVGGDASLGVGLDMVDDLPLKWTFARGFKVLANSIARRLITPFAAASWAPNDGYDVRQLLKSGQTTRTIAQAQARITTEVEKDERVSSASTSIQINGETAIITIAISTASGPFNLILAVTALTVEILEAGGQ